MRTAENKVRPKLGFTESKPVIFLLMNLALHIFQTLAIIIFEMWKTD